MRWATPAALPLVVAVASFAVGLGNEFVLDDQPAILGNGVVVGDVPAWEAFVRNFWGGLATEPPPAYRPLTVLTFALDRALFGLNAVAFHITSLAYFVLAVHLLHRVARTWLSDRASVLAATLFAVLPVHAEAVASLVGRADTLALVGTLACLLALAPAFRSEPLGARRLALAAGAYALALLAKESAALLPAVVWILIEFTAKDRSRRPADLLRRWRAPLLFGAVGLGYLGLRASLLPSAFGGYNIPDDVLADATIAQRITYALGLVGRYAELVVAPFDLCTGRKFAVVALPAHSAEPFALLGVALLGLVAWASVRAWRARRPPFMLAALVTWFVFSSVLLSVPEAMADRFLTTPSAFVVLAVAGPAAKWASTGRLRSGLLIVLIAGQGLLTGFYATRWASNASLLEHAVLACPASVHNQFRFARHLSENGHHGEAAWHMAVASQIRGHFPNAWEHPAPNAAVDLPVEDRLARMHALLEVTTPEAAWRRGLADYLAGLGLRQEARLVVESSPVPLRG